MSYDSSKKTQAPAVPLLPAAPSKPALDVLQILSDFASHNSDFASHNFEDCTQGLEAMTRMIVLTQQVPPWGRFGLELPKGGVVLSVTAYDDVGPVMSILVDRNQAEYEGRHFHLVEQNTPFNVDEEITADFICSFQFANKLFHLFELVPETLREFSLIPKPSDN